MTCEDDREPTSEDIKSGNLATKIVFYSAAVVVSGFLWYLISLGIAKLLNYFYDLY